MDSTALLTVAEIKNTNRTQQITDGFPMLVDGTCRLFGTKNADDQVQCMKIVRTSCHHSRTSNSRNQEFEIVSRRDNAPRSGKLVKICNKRNSYNKVRNKRGDCDCVTTTCLCGSSATTVLSLFRLLLKHIRSLTMY